MFCRRKFTLGMFEESVRNCCPKCDRNERKSVRRLNVRNKTSEIFCKEHVSWEPITAFACLYLESVYVIKARRTKSACFMLYQPFSQWRSMSVVAKKIAYGFYHFYSQRNHSVTVDLRRLIFVDTS